MVLQQVPHQTAVKLAKLSLLVLTLCMVVTLTVP